MSVKVKV
jgi:hypothetical protein